MYLGFVVFTFVGSCDLCRLSEAEERGEIHRPILIVFTFLLRQVKHRLSITPMQIEIQIRLLKIKIHIQPIAEHHANCDYPRGSLNELLPRDLISFDLVSPLDDLQISHTVGH